MASLACSCSRANASDSASTKSKCHFSMWLITPSRLTKVEFTIFPMVFLSGRAPSGLACGGVGSVVDAVADVGRLRGIDHPDDVQLDQGRQLVEQAAAAAEQDGDLVDLDFVQHPHGERLLRGVPALHVHVPAGGGGLG